MKMATSKKVDRLTNLPDEIRLHILSFLDTRSAVRTSTLSKQWETLWTCVPNLDFGNGDYRSTRFKEFVLAVLSRRNPNACVGKLQLRKNEEWDNNLELKVIDYALSHGVNTLQLSCCKFPRSFCFRPTLTTLHLECCQFWMCDDVFVSCPNLKYLRLLKCCFRDCKVLKLSGTQLVNLTVDSLGTRLHKDVYANFKVEISAPKLRTLSHRDSADLEFSSINLPSLEHAEIRVFMPSRIRLTKKEVEKKMVYLNLFRFFRSLRHVQSLTLFSCTCEALATIPGMIESQHPPFTRLKTFELKGNFFDETVPKRIEPYFLNGHPSVDTTVVKPLRLAGRIEELVA